jgi:hypothetical protein
MRIDKDALDALARITGSEASAQKLIEERIGELATEARESLSIMHECERMLVEKQGDKQARTKRWNESFLDYMEAMDLITDFTGDRNEARRLIAERMN